MDLNLKLKKKKNNEKAELISGKCVPDDTEFNPQNTSEIFMMN